MDSVEIFVGTTTGRKWNDDFNEKIKYNDPDGKLWRIHYFDCRIWILLSSMKLILLPSYFYYSFNDVTWFAWEYFRSIFTVRKFQFRYQSANKIISGIVFRCSVKIWKRKWFWIPLTPLRSDKYLYLNFVYMLLDYFTFHFYLHLLTK